MASIEREAFWGCVLSKEKKEYSWDSEDEELSKADIEQKLVLSQACLGAKAKADERNIVEVTTTDISDNSVTHTILSLQRGRKDQCRLSLGFPSSAVFKLVEGSGPLHLTGSIYQELHMDEEDEEESDEDEKPANFVKSEADLNSKKRPLASETPKGPPLKLARVEDAEDEDESDEDEEDEEESSEESEKMEVDTTQKQKKPDTPPKGPQGKPGDKDTKVKKEVKKENEVDEESDEEASDEEEDESDEEDEDESEEDESEEEDEDEEDESEEDEITTSLAGKKKGGKPEQKKPITNGVAKPGKKSAEEKGKPNKATVKQEPSTPKTSGKKDDSKKAASKTPEPLDMEKIKEKLKKTPTLPKKMDKFKNYMRSSFKISDETTVTKLWEWLQENK